MSLTKVREPSSNFKGNRSRKDKYKKKRKAEEFASDIDKQKTVKQAYVAYNNFMDVDLHIYMTRESPIPFAVDSSVTLQI